MALRHQLINIRCGGWRLSWTKWGTPLRISLAYGHVRRAPWYEHPLAESRRLGRYITQNSVHEFRDQPGWHWLQICSLFGAGMG